MSRSLVWTAAISALLVTGCGAQSATTADQPTRVVEGSFAKSYSSFPALLADSTALVSVTASGKQLTAPATAGALSSTDTYVHVNSVLWGDVPEKDVPIRQLGLTSDVRPDFAPLLQSGDNYVLALSPFEFGHGKPTGEFVITGEVGMFSAGGDGTLRTLSPIASEIGFPASVSRAQVAAATHDTTPASAPPIPKYDAS